MVLEMVGHTVVVFGLGDYVAINVGSDMRDGKMGGLEKRRGDKGGSNRGRGPGDAK
jgi:hypothetical protein